MLGTLFTVKISCGALFILPIPPFYSYYRTVRPTHNDIPTGLDPSSPNEGRLESCGSCHTKTTDMRAFQPQVGVHRGYPHPPRHRAFARALSNPGRTRGPYFGHCLRGALIRSTDSVLNQSQTKHGVTTSTDRPRTLSDLPNKTVRIARTNLARC